MNLRSFTFSAAIFIPTCFGYANGPEGSLPVEPFDMDELRTTWRNLANEQVMFPLDMKDMPAKIGKERQLFLDNYLIAEAQHVTREVHQPERFEGNPIIIPHTPKTEDMEYLAVVMNVMQFKTPPRFRMWYQSYPRWHSWENDQRIRFASSYAVSDDGVKWRKPDLDLHKIEDSELRNIVIPYGLMHGVFYEPDEPDPQKRFKALVCVEARNTQTREFTIPEGYYLHTSPDGIHWKGDLSRRILSSLYQGNQIPQTGVGDTTRFWWDPLRKTYIGDVKFVVNISGKQRCRGIMESDDLIHWSRPRPTFFGRSGDNQIYGHRGFVYQGMYIGMRWIYVPGRSKHHSNNVELDCSRDGSIWTRVGAGQPFMAFNPNRDTWDAGKMRPVAMLEVGDEIWIYYNGKPTDFETGNPEFPDSQRVGNSAGLAKLPRDRFASINAGDNTGTLVTRPLHFQGKKLYVNAEVQKGGSIKVALLSRDSKPMEQYSLMEAVPIETGGLTVPVKWKRASQFELPGGEHVRIQFQLANAKLYSFWIE